MFDTLTPVEGQTVNMGDGGTTAFLGEGSISACVPIFGARTVSGTFTDVQFAPGLTVNLLSLAAMMAKGLSVSFVGRVCTIRNQQKKVIGRKCR
jgi:hypothetical protein